MTTGDLGPANAPLASRRLLGALLLSIAFVTSMTLHIAHREILIPLYMFATCLFLVVFNWVEASRLGAYLKAHFPEEYRRLAPREHDYGYNSMPGFRFAFSAARGDAPALAQIRRRVRRTWLESLLLLPCMGAVIVVAVAWSK